MNHLAHAQENARRFNEAEAIQHDYEDRCALRRLPGPATPLPVETLDDLDWLEAVRINRQARAIAWIVP